MEGGFRTIDEQIELIQQGKFPLPCRINGTLVHTAEEALAMYRDMNARHANLVRVLREKWLATPAGKLCLEAYQKLQEYKAYLEQNPNARPDYSAVGVDFKEHDFFKQDLLMLRGYEREVEERRLRNLRRAHEAARCDHRHADGRRCGSPRVRGKKLCYWHDQMQAARALKLDLGPMEDADSIQIAIKKLQRAVIDGTLDPKQTGQLAYTIQLAAWNVSKTKMARETKDEEVQ